MHSVARRPTVTGEAGLLLERGNEFGRGRELLPYGRQEGPAPGPRLENESIHPGLQRLDQLGLARDGNGHERTRDRYLDRKTDPLLGRQREEAWIAKGGRGRVAGDIGDQGAGRLERADAAAQIAVAAQADEGRAQRAKRGVVSFDVYRERCGVAQARFDRGSRDLQ